MASAHSFAINKCEDSEGRISYQESPCANDEVASQINIARQAKQLDIPNANWALRYQAPEMTPIDERFADHHFQYVASAKTGLVMSVFVEPAQGKGRDKRSCGDYYWQLTAQNPMIIARTVDRTDTTDFIIVSYAIKVPDGDSWLVQGNYNLYGFRENRCIDIHLSKLYPTDSDINFSEFITFASSLEFIRR